MAVDPAKPPPELIFFAAVFPGSREEIDSPRTAPSTKQSSANHCPSRSIGEGAGSTGSVSQMHGVTCAEPKPDQGAKTVRKASQSRTRVKRKILLKRQLIPKRYVLTMLIATFSNPRQAKFVGRERACPHRDDSSWRLTSLRTQHVLTLTRAAAIVVPA